MMTTKCSRNKQELVQHQERILKGNAHQETTTVKQGSKQC